MKYLFFLLSVAAFAQSPSVVICGADPTGVRDSTAAFLKCLSNFPSGDIMIPSGTYKLTGTINKNRNQNLIGQGEGATTLECQMTEGPCIVVADQAGATNYISSKIQDLTLAGPGANSASIGVFFGGDPGNSFSLSTSFGDFANLIDVRVTGFNHGVSWGNNARLNKFLHVSIFGNSSGFYVPAGLANSGEGMGLTDSAIFNNSMYGVEDHSAFEWLLSGTSFDYNATQFFFIGSTIHAVNCHFEQVGNQFYSQPSGSGSLSIDTSEIFMDSSAGLIPATLAPNGSGQLIATGTASTITYPSPTQVITIGDSITNGAGATSAGNSWGYGVASDLTGQLPKELAVGGTLTCDGLVQEVWPAYNPTSSSPTLATMMFGTNDANSHNGPSGYEATATLCRNAAAEWLTIPIGPSKVYQQNCALTGSWTNASGVIGGISYPAGVAAFTNTSGDSAVCTITTNGGPIYGWYLMQDGATNAFTYRLDSGPVTSVPISPATAIGVGTNSGVGSYRIAGVPAGTHTVTVVAGGGFELFYGIGTVPPSSSSNPRLVIMGVPKERTASADAAAGTSYYDADAQASASLLASDGLSVLFANIRSYVCVQFLNGVCANASGLPDMTDTLHPSDQGEIEFKQAVESTVALPANNSVNTLPTLAFAVGTGTLGTGAAIGGNVTGASSRTGSIVSGTNGPVVFTLGNIPVGSPSIFSPSTNPWNCTYQNLTTPRNIVLPISSTKTSSTAAGITAARDVIAYTCSN